MARKKGDRNAQYHEQLSRVSRVQKARTAAGQDISDIPEVADPVRKERCKRSLKAFCEEYFPARFNLAWSGDQLKVIDKLERAVKDGGLFALAMMRGGGKTAISEVGVIWSLVTGLHFFVYLIACTQPQSTNLLTNLKKILATNKTLASDFPEVCYPIQRLEGETRRAGGQKHHGKPTNIEWKANRITLPSIVGSPASGSMVWTAGLEAAIRGPLVTRDDGSTMRPSLVILDDPQTDESSRSTTQTDHRELTIEGAVLEMVGPGRKMAAIMPCTIINPNDLSHRYLDKNLHPEWQGERMQALNEWPADMKLWEKYAEIWKTSMIDYGDIRKATEFYTANRIAMDEGAAVAWSARYDPDEISALQFCMDKWIKNPRVFMAEFQNDPLPEIPEDEEQVTSEQIAKKVNNHKRYRVPNAASRLTAFIDIGGKLLHYIVCAWEENFTGYVIDYGEYPDQRRALYTSRNAQKTLAWAKPGAGLEGQIYAGLEALVEKAIAREYRREDGAILRVERCLTDANWGQTTEVIYQFCRQSKSAAVLTPSHGKYVGASSKPLGEYKKAQGDRVGLNWRMPTGRAKRSLRFVLYDTNFWKSFINIRLGVPMGDDGCLSLFGGNPQRHQLFSEHLHAEYKVRTEGRGRVVDEWKVRPEQADNHWWDCLVGAAVAASTIGVTLPGTEQPRNQKRTISFSEMQKQKRREKHGR